jgi:hypothetical protein
MEDAAGTVWTFFVESGGQQAGWVPVDRLERAGQPVEESNPSCYATDPETLSPETGDVMVLEEVGDGRFFGVMRLGAGVETFSGVLGEFPSPVNTWYVGSASAGTPSGESEFWQLLPNGVVVDDRAALPFVLCADISDVVDPLRDFVGDFQPPYPGE